jgi:hypothetical protein
MALSTQEKSELIVDNDVAQKLPYVLRNTMILIHMGRACFAKHMVIFELHHYQPF